jgi:hypothetical protein
MIKGGKGVCAYFGCHSFCAARHWQCPGVADLVVDIRRTARATLEIASPSEARPNISLDHENCVNEILLILAGLIPTSIRSDSDLEVPTPNPAVNQA